MLHGLKNQDHCLGEEDVRNLIASALAEARLDSKRVLIIIPDGTRSAPIPLMFRLFHELLGVRAASLDYLIALGTHPPMSGEAINQLVGVTPMERTARYPHVKIFNHRWDAPDTFAALGEISASEIERMTGGLFRDSLLVRVNRLVLDYDQIIICGPTFPHEVVGFSGGNKYFFPGVGGAEIINFTHWLGAMLTSFRLIGTRDTPVRRIIDRAAAFISRPKLCFSMVVKDDGLAGLYIGTPEEAFDRAADLSSTIHINWVEKPFRRVLSVIPSMYTDLWTAAKGMYKLEPAIADGGEVVIYAPHIHQISETHGRLLEQIGYHVRDYFVKQWDRFKDLPGGVLAHSTHLRGIGSYDAVARVETPRIKVTLATRISEAQCHRVNLHYLDPDKVDFDEWRGRESEGILLVPKAGEELYRVRPENTIS